MMPAQDGEPDDPKAGTRKTMVAEQIAERGIHDPAIINVMCRVPRHIFVPDEYQEQAYYDGPLPIGHGQTISQPYIVAYMTDLLRIKPSDRVLEIGTGSGYQTAVLAELAAEVFTVEINEPLSNEARSRLLALGYSNIRFRTGNGWKGWPEEAPFDKIIVTAAPAEMPEALCAQLKEGGKIVIPVGVESQSIIEGEKHHGNIQTHSKIAVRFVPLVNP
jgi:protein-L-isoaspartate(D-aspartate) O-methyltransferase